MHGPVRGAEERAELVARRGRLAARERAAVTQEELASRVAEQLNQRMYALSIVAGVFLPLSFATGLLGINVAGIPGAETGWAFAAVCGALAVLGVGEQGFRRPATMRDRPARWTNGHAVLSVPLRDGQQPRSLEVELATAPPGGTKVEILVNGVRVFAGRVPRRPWSTTVSLEELTFARQTRIEIISGTFTPAEEFPDSTDRRTLGVAVWGVTLR